MFSFLKKHKKKYPEYLMSNEDAIKLKKPIKPEDFTRIEGQAPRHYTVDIILRRLAGGGYKGAGLNHHVIRELGIDLDHTTLTARPEKSAGVYNFIREALLSAYDKDLRKSDSLKSRCECASYLFKKMDIFA